MISPNKALGSVNTFRMLFQELSFSLFEVRQLQLVQEEGRIACFNGNSVPQFI